MLDLTKKNIVTGLKQTARALREDRALCVYIAGDAEVKVTADVLALCREKNVATVDVPSMKELGKICGIEVAAAMAAEVSSN